MPRKNSGVKSTAQTMEPFKNVFNAESVARIAAAIARAYPEFDRKRFLAGVEAELAARELKDRVRFLADRLRETLPADPKRAIPILVAAAKRDERDAIGVEGFLAWPFSDYVGRFGLDAFAVSMKALRELTAAFSSEFAIRPYLARYEREALSLLEEWSRDESEHVRRLVSEGSRPLLPWGERLPAFVKDPRRTWPLLERLRKDSSEYVRRSVANHLNDHSKHHPKFVLERVRAIVDAEAVLSKETAKFIRHALRSLIKRGDPAALRLIGVDSRGVEIESFRITKASVRIGEAVTATLVLRNASAKPRAVVVDYEFRLLGARGQPRVKVFKGRNLTLPPKGRATLELSQKLRAVTTRAYYPGEQAWAALVNGKRTAARKFRLRA